MAVLEKKQSHNYKRTKVHFNNGFSPPCKKYFCAAGRKSQLPEGIPSVSRESFVSDKFRKGKSRLEQAFYFQPTFSSFP